MRRRFWVPGSLCLIVSALAWQTPSSAQGVCYFVDAAGQVIDLAHLCQGHSTSESMPAQPETSTEIREDSSTADATYTIVGPVRQTASPTSSVTSSNSRSSATRNSAVPPATGSRTIRIQSVQTEDFTITTIDNPDRVVNGVLIEGRDRLIIGPGVPQQSDHSESGAEE